MNYCKLFLLLVLTSGCKESINPQALSAEGMYTRFSESDSFFEFDTISVTLISSRCLEFMVRRNKRTISKYTGGKFSFSTEKGIGYYIPGEAGIWVKGQGITYVHDEDSHSLVNGTLKYIKQ